jgi:hypothetical protein
VKCLKYFSVLGVLIAGLPAKAQENSGLSAIYVTAYDSAISNLTESQRNIYNGREYYPYYIKPTVKNYSTYGALVSGHRPGEHPFFSTEFKAGLIVYEGVAYTKIELVYDLVRDEVVILDEKKKMICLPYGKVSKFVYAGHTFEFIDTVDGLSPGFYDVLFSSTDVSLYARRSRIQTELWRNIVTYTVKIKDSVYTVNSKKKLLIIMDDQESEIRNYIQDNNLNFRKDLEASLVKVVAYYAQLKK